MADTLKELHWRALRNRRGDMTKEREDGGGQEEIKAKIYVTG
jgi:hypothetical protein